MTGGSYLQVHKGARSLTPCGLQIENIECSFFLHLINFLKALTDLEFLISAVTLFHSFMQYGKKVFLKDFILDKECLITEGDMNLK